jgi:prepilin-type N-terminal cleavage/methylation domain-containing protein
MRMGKRVKTSRSGPHSGPAMKNAGDLGFTLIEVLLVLAVIGIVSAIAVPSTSAAMRGYTLKGDARAVYNLVALAKMRAAAHFSRARVHVDRANNTYVLEIWNKTAKTWDAETVPTRTSRGVTFGFGALTAPPPNTQNAIGFSPVCTGDGDNPPVIPNSSCVTFNSRGMPVTNTGLPTGNNGLYLTDGTAVYGTTVTTTPQVRLWWSRSTDPSWTRQ